MNKKYFLILFTFSTHILSSEKRDTTSLRVYRKKDETGKTHPVHTLAAKTAFSYFKSHPEQTRASLKSILWFNGSTLNRITFKAMRVFRDGELDEKAVKITELVIK